VPNSTAKRVSAQSDPPALTAARRYVRLGWHVYPVKPGTKRPALSEEDTGRKRGASNDLATVERMFRDPRCEYADIGVVTGAVSGIWVLDIDKDDKKDGFASLDKLLYDHRDSRGHRARMPKTATVETASGGVHYYFRHPGRHVRDPTLGRGIDVIGDNLAIVAPPSNGRRWGVGGFSRIAPTPAFLLPLICEDRPRPPPRVRTASIAPQEYAGPAPSREVLDLMKQRAGRGVVTSPEDMQLPEDTELKIQFALTAIPRQDYREWMRIGGMIACALRGVADDDGRGLWEEWAEEINEFKWSECMKHGAFDSDGRSLFYLADKYDPERLWRRAYDIALIKMYQRGKA
jgi:Bifunctional DNA primase/polymerase, N-terminal